MLRVELVEGMRGGRRACGGLGFYLSSGNTPQQLRRGDPLFHLVDLWKAHSIKNLMEI